MRKRIKTEEKKRNGEKGEREKQETRNNRN